jgi:hypothetical protein
LAAWDSWETWGLGWGWRQATIVLTSEVNEADVETQDCWNLVVTTELLWVGAGSWGTQGVWESEQEKTEVAGSGET